MGNSVIWDRRSVNSLREGLKIVGPRLLPQSLEWLSQWKMTHVADSITYAQLLTRIYRERREFDNPPELAPWFIPLLREAMKNEKKMRPEFKMKVEAPPNEEEPVRTSPGKLFDVSRAEQLIQRLGALAADTLECREFYWSTRVKAGALIAEAIKLLKEE